MKKTAALMFAFLLIFCWHAAQGAQAAETGNTGVLLVIGGESVTPDVPPMIHNSRTMVPVRVVSEELGAVVKWNDKTRTAEITRNNTLLILQLDNRVAKLNGKEVVMDAPPMIVQQRMLLPLRFVGEALGATVGWEESTRTVYVNDPVSVTVNGEELTGSLKVYKIADGFYLPVEEIAGRTGLALTQESNDVLILNNWQEEYRIVIGKPLPLSSTVSSKKKRTADSTSSDPVVRKIENMAFVPLERLDKLINGQAEWDKENKQIIIKHTNTLESFSAEGTTINISTSEPVSPQHFTLVMPHRIVLDLPATELSPELLEQLRAKELEEANEDEQQQTSDSVNVDGEDSEDAKKDNDSEQQPDPDTDEETDADTELSEENTTLLEKYPVIKEIRYSQFADAPYIVRIVIELHRKSKYHIIPGENGFTLTLEPVPPKTGYLIVVDAGHGGKDPGAKGVAGNVEKDFNLNVAMMMVDMLKEYKEFQVVTTRSDDTFISLEERVQLANDMDADLFISIHANSYTPKTRGTETYYYNDYSEPFARIVHRHLIAATGFPDRKVQIAPFYVIKNTDMPAVLTETGFLSNREENSYLIKKEFQQKVARALVDAIREYYLTNKQ